MLPARVANRLFAALIACALVVAWGRGALASAVELVAGVAASGEVTAAVEHSDDSATEDCHGCPHEEGGAPCDPEHCHCLCCGHAPFMTWWPGRLDVEGAGNGAELELAHPAEPRSLDDARGIDRPPQRFGA